MRYITCFLLMFTAQAPPPCPWHVELLARCIRHSGLPQWQRGPLLMKFVEKGMNPNQVQAIFGASAVPMEMGTGFNCTDYWYINHGVIVCFQNHKVVQVLYNPPPTDTKGVVPVGLD